MEVYALSAFEGMLLPPPGIETGGRTHERKNWNEGAFRVPGSYAGGRGDGNGNADSTCGEYRRTNQN